MGASDCEFVKLPDTALICGPNHAGKTALLKPIMEREEAEGTRMLGVDAYGLAKRHRPGGKGGTPQGQPRRTTSFTPQKALPGRWRRRSRHCRAHLRYRLLRKDELDAIYRRLKELHGMGLVSDAYTAALKIGSSLDIAVCGKLTCDYWR